MCLLFLSTGVEKKNSADQKKLLWCALPIRGRFYPKGTDKKKNKEKFFFCYRCMQVTANDVILIKVTRLFVYVFVGARKDEFRAGRQLALRCLEYDCAGQYPRYAPVRCERYAIDLYKKKPEQKKKINKKKKSVEKKKNRRKKKKKREFPKKVKKSEKNAFTRNP